MSVADKFHSQRLGKVLDKQNVSYETMLNEVSQIELKPSILLMSGGLDTTTLLYWLWNEKVPLHVISFDYGQEAIKEIQMAKRHCERLNVSHEVVKISSYAIDGNLAPNNNHVLDDETLVPARNSTFLSIGTSYALQHGYERVYYGATGDVNPVYLDCRAEYVHQFNLLNMMSDLKVVQIRAPLLKKNKHEILEMAMDFGIDLRDTWSCYYNGERPCGVCSSCKDRKRFEREVRDRLQRKVRMLDMSLRFYED